MRNILSEPITEKLARVGISISNSLNTGLVFLIPYNMKKNPIQKTKKVIFRSDQRPIRSSYSEGLYQYKPAIKLKPKMIPLISAMTGLIKLLGETWLSSRRVVPIIPTIAPEKAKL